MNRHLTLSIADQGIVSAFNFALNLYLVRVAAPDDFGLFAIVNAASLFAAMVQNAIVNTPLSVHLPAAHDAAVAASLPPEPTGSARERILEEACDLIAEDRDWNEAVATGQTTQITMQGQAVFRWATSFIADAARRTLEASGLTPDELDLFVPHQANNRITDSMLRHLKLPETVTVARTIRNFGNNSAASIPIALDAMIASGEAKSGDTCLIIGFGAGLVYAGQVITIP